MNSKELTNEQIEVLLTAIGNYKRQMENTNQWDKAHIASGVCALLKRTENK